jgi:transcriptional regulator with XRE-family HTH domain
VTALAPPLVLTRGLILELRKLFGTCLRQGRRSRGLTQAQLAEASSLSLEMIGRLERGVAAPSFDTIEVLAGMLDVPPAVLFGAEPAVAAGKRRDLLDRINRLLASASDPELERVARVLSALLRD